MEAVPGYLLPTTAAVGPSGALSIGGVDVIEIAREYGTPSFIYDEAHLRSRCAEAVAAFPDGVAYASKAFLCTAMARIVAEAGMRIDVASGGELHVALRAGVPANQIVLHGNNKSEAELTTAICEQIALIVIDSFDEIDRINRIHEALGSSPPVPCLIRVTPGIEAHTHEYIMTGQEDSKFGFSLATGEAQRGVDRIRECASIALVGAHSHIGSLIFDTTAFEREVEILAPFVIENELHELCVGGGLGIAYVTGEAAPTITEWGQAIRKAVAAAGIPDYVAVTAEPGRSIVGNAAITVYTVGTIKEVVGIRSYLSVDGGMSDNPRPVLYGSGYEAFLPRSTNASRDRVVTVVGKHCESGDLLIRDAYVPIDINVGDILATPVTGAYGYTMASNYNKVPRPAVVLVGNGTVRTIIRRETYEDLVRLDIT